MNTPLINGVMYSWASIKVNIMGVLITGITKIEYSEEQEIEPLMGAGNHAIGVSYNDVKKNGSITLYANEVDRLEDVSPTGRLQDIPPFPVIVSFNTGGKVKTHKLMYCIFTKNSRGSGTGDKKIEVEIPLFVGNIIWK